LVVREEVAVGGQSKDVGNEDVTVVVTCFNYGQYLEEAVNSALQQTGGPPHVIVVDDGSTDPETSNVLGSLPGEVDIVRQSNQGVSVARNTGLARATTPFVLVLDADDRLASSALTSLRPALMGNPRIGYAYGLSRFFGDWEGILRFPRYDPYRLLYRHIVGLSALMRREVVDVTGGFDPSFDNYADWEFWLHALECGWHGVQVDSVTLEYRRHGGSMSIEDLREYREVFARIRKKHAALYPDRPAQQSELGPVGRLIYRFFWGLRPMPASLERRLQALHWRPRSQQ
jgi:glycosyltransferase involved in cell wall biosynthesis